MPIPLSHDLRTRIVAACKTDSKTEVAKQFQVSRRTVHRYLEQITESGDVKAKSGYQTGHSHKLLDLEPLRKIIESNPTKTLVAIGKELNVSHSTVHRKLAKLGNTKKKNTPISRKR